MQVPLTKGRRVGAGSNGTAPFHLRIFIQWEQCPMKEQAAKGCFGYGPLFVRETSSYTLKNKSACRTTNGDGGRRRLCPRSHTDVGSECLGGHSEPLNLSIEKESVGIHPVGPAAGLQEQRVNPGLASRRNSANF